SGRHSRPYVGVPESEYRPGPPDQGHDATAPKATPAGVVPSSPPSSANPEIPLGRRLSAGKAGDAVTVPVRWLEKHTVVCAGAGSGKTVLLRRLVEEAALLGIP